MLSPNPAAGTGPPVTSPPCAAALSAGTFSWSALAVASVFLVAAGAWWWANRELEEDYSMPAATQSVAVPVEKDTTKKGKKKAKKAPPPARINENIG